MSDEYKCTDCSHFKTSVCNSCVAEQFRDGSTGKPSHFVLADKKVSLGSPGNDIVNEPPHYTNGGIETIDYIKAKLTLEQYQGHLIANVLKYVSRHRHKNGVEDLKKARWYLDRLIGEMNGNM